MDTFWSGILIGGVISLAASICVNLFHNRIVAFLGNRKLASQANSFKKAAYFHALIKELHSGKRDKHVYLMRMLVPILGRFLASIIALCAGMIISTVLHGSPQQSTVVYQVNQGVLLFVAVGGMALYPNASFHFRAITNALNSFDEFDSAFREKWQSRPDAERQ